MVSGRAPRCPSSFPGGVRYPRRRFTFIVGQRREMPGGEGRASGRPAERSRSAPPVRAHVATEHVQLGMGGRPGSCLIFLNLD